MRDVSVKRLLRVFIVIALPGQPHTNSIGHITDTRLPNFLVQARIDTHVGGPHHLRRKFADLLHSTGGLLLKAISTQLGMEVDRVLACNNLRAFRLTVAGLTRAENRKSKISVLDKTPHTTVALHSSKRSVVSRSEDQ
jgi:hypothetical protein